jgi:hypothetical protein
MSKLKPMSKNIILHPRAVARSTFWMVLIGAASALLLLLLQRLGVEGARPLLAGLGAPSALFGGGIAAGCAISTRDRRCALIAAASLFPLAFWAWVIYERVYRQYAS